MGLSNNVTLPGGTGKVVTNPGGDGQTWFYSEMVAAVVVPEVQVIQVVPLTTNQRC